MKKRAKQEIHFAVCINNKKYEAFLEVGKLYRIIPVGDDQIKRAVQHRTRLFERRIRNVAYQEQRR